MNGYNTMTGYEMDLLENGVLLDGIWILKTGESRALKECLSI